MHGTICNDAAYGMEEQEKQKALGNHGSPASGKDMAHEKIRGTLLQKCCLHILLQQYTHEKHL